MSFQRDMKKYKLQKNIPERSPSGASKDVWTDVGDIYVAVYKKNDMRVLASERYVESSHTGLTYRREIKADVYRLIRGETVYLVTDSNSEGRMTNLLLRVVTGHVG